MVPNFFILQFYLLLYDINMIGAYSLHVGGDGINIVDIFGGMV